MKIEKLSVWELVQPYRHFTRARAINTNEMIRQKKNNQLVFLLQRLLRIKLYLQPLF